MATGACGVNCDVCQLNLLGTCSSCGPGRSEEAARKSEAQRRVLGHPCAILACARLNHIDYCPRDCVSFPCGNFSGSKYPYGRAFLAMQQRRREEGPPAVDPNGRPVEVDASMWDALRQREPEQLANFTLSSVDPQTGLFSLAFLNRTLFVDPTSRRLLIKGEREPRAVRVPLLEIVVLDYLSRIDSLHPMKRELIGVDDLIDAHYFSGRGRLRKAPLLARFGEDPNGFANAGAFLGGQTETMGDVAFRLFPFPRIPVCYVLWLGSDEFAPRLSILFDRSIEKVLSAPAIWCLVTLCTYYLIRGVMP